MALPTTSPAARQVFDIAEILEMILLRVENKTLLLSQRVDTTFAATVQFSHRIQRKLFFALPAKKSDNNAQTWSMVNHLLMDFDIAFGTRGSFFRIWSPRHVVQEKRSWYFYYCVDPFNRTHKPTGHESWRRMLLGDKIECARIEYACSRCDHRERQALSQQSSHENVTLGQVVRYLLAHHDPYLCRRGALVKYGSSMILTGRVVTEGIEGGPRAN